MALNMPPATPQRQGPGTFPQTPARPPPFSLGSVQQQQAPAPIPSQIQLAAKAINRMLDNDNRYPPLEAYSKPGVSGEYELSTNQAWAPFQKLRSYEHPEGMYDQVNEMQMSVDMGLFAEINHAYVAVDNQLYLWDYTARNPELIGFEELKDNITCVKLVKPRAKVFVDSISWLLVIATTAEIHLTAVECQSGPEGVYGVNLYRTGMSVSVRGINVTAIASSAKTGRIFFGESATEDVWELNYQQEEKWFSNRCSKKNHVTSSVAIPLPSISFGKRAAPVGLSQMIVDDSRNLLYTLSTNSTVKVFHMRTFTTLENVIKRDLGTIRGQVSHLIRQVPALDNLRIVGIDPISAAEADSVSLMLTSSTGVRLYMSATSGGWDSTGAPSNMAVMHVRFPPVPADAQTAPPPNATSTQMQPYQGGTPIGFDSRILTQTVGTFRYAPGTFLCAVEKNPTNPNHELFISSAHTGQLLSERDPRFTESGQTITLRGKLQDAGLVTPPFSAGHFGSEYAVQFDLPAAEFAVMTHYGVETVRRRRLVDTFAAIIRYGGGAEGVEADVRRFARHYGLTETASTALAVACGQGTDVGADSRVIPITDPEVTEVARKTFIEYGGKPQITESAAVEGLSVDNVQPSPRHDGIALYVARLVRSIWDTPIIRETVTPTGPMLAPNHKIAKLQDIQRSLIRLQQFLDDNKTFIDGLAGPEALGRVSSRREEVELQGENRALTNLLQMINNIVEGIAFSLVLFEERLEEILLLLAPEVRLETRKLTYHALFASSEGKELAKELVKAIVNHNIVKGSNVETVAEALRRKCGSFCSSDDVVIFKASENLKKAADLGANAERGRIQLNDSLRLFEQVAKSLTMEHLSAAVDKYIELEFYAGAIRLALKVAEERDRGNRALSWIKDGQPSGDARQLPYAQRTNCYKLVFKVIEAVDQVSGAQANVEQDGVMSQIGRRKQEAYDQINNSEDEVFQNFLYDWYMEKSWAERLLEISSPYVVDYLKRSSETNPAHADLLWKYYAHYNDYLGAAEVQYQLAKSPTFKLTLEQRIEYLSRAKANASTRIAGFSDSGTRTRQSRQELLRNISDHLDVGNIQDDLLQKIKSDKRLQGARREEVLADLNSAVKPVNELFNDYADQAGYYNISLLLFHQADFRDLSTIRNTWQLFIEQTHNEAVAEGKASPWEAVAIETETLGRRVGTNQNIFPVSDVFQLLLQYDVEKYRQGPSGNIDPDNNHPPAWPIDIFVKLHAPFENLVSVLEAMWYARDHPFNSRNGRKLLAKWLVCVVEKWWENSRRSGEPFGSTENALGLSDLLRVVMESGDFVAAGSGADDAQWVERLRVIREKADEIVR
ncbi:hypothetical protein SLS60_008011 [Paraconiothyrium brasiliense]|uniref:Nucleoporin n=1 Tax=Paraconiothyrium brasiliense TaxID=300254 RepID=A0ABR3R379_9PLEO